MEFDLPKRFARPEPLETADMKPLNEVCKVYLDFIESEEYHEDNDYRQYIYEQAMMSIYGKDVFKWINQKTA